ncbi:VanZ family protein [Pontiella sp.]|uniref:VanZ family protein n=1 Tax=Pontiella sp. TaxID=2837462 RepID=UPI0035698AC8
MNEWAGKLMTRLPALLMLAATLIFWPNFDPCAPAGPALLDSPTLAAAAVVEGDCSETGAVFELRMAPGGIDPCVQFVLPDGPAPEMIRLGGRIRAENPGGSAWLSLIQRRDTGGRSNGGQRQLIGDGSFGWTYYQNDYSVSRWTRKLEVTLQSFGEEGTVWFDSIRAVPIAFRASLPWIRGAFAVAWLGIGAAYYFIGRLNTRRLRHLILLNALVIVVGVLLPNHWLQVAPGKIRRALGENVEAARSTAYVQAGFGVARHIEQTIGRSFGHFALFGSLAFWVLFSAALEGQHPARYYGKVAGDLFLFGLCTEALQHLTPDRTVDVDDMLCNAYGILVAMPLFAVVWNSRAWVILRKHRRASRRFVRPPDDPSTLDS